MPPCHPEPSSGLWCLHDVSTPSLRTSTVSPDALLSPSENARTFSGLGGPLRRSLLWWTHPSSLTPLWRFWGLGVGVYCHLRSALVSERLFFWSVFGATVLCRVFFKPCRELLAQEMGPTVVNKLVPVRNGHQPVLSAHHMGKASPLPRHSTRVGEDPTEQGDLQSRRLSLRLGWRTSSGVFFCSKTIF